MLQRGKRDADKWHTSAVSCWPELCISVKLLDSSKLSAVGSLPSTCQAFRGERGLRCALCTRRTCVVGAFLRLGPMPLIRFSVQKTDTFLIKEHPFFVATTYNRGRCPSRGRSPEGAAGVPGGGLPRPAPPGPLPGLAFGGRVSPEKLAGGGWEERSELVQGWPVAKLGLDSETPNTV